jgi:hypothetical protein
MGLFYTPLLWIWYAVMRSGIVYVVGMFELGLGFARADLSVTTHNYRLVAWQLLAPYLGHALRGCQGSGDQNINYCHLAMTRDKVVVNARALLSDVPTSFPPLLAIAVGCHAQPFFSFFP